MRARSMLDADLLHLADRHPRLSPLQIVHAVCGDAIFAKTDVVPGSMMVRYDGVVCHALWRVGPFVVTHDLHGGVDLALAIDLHPGQPRRLPPGTAHPDTLVALFCGSRATDTYRAFRQGLRGALTADLESVGMPVNNLPAAVARIAPSAHLRSLSSVLMSGDELVAYETGTLAPAVTYEVVSAADELAVKGARLRDVLARLGISGNAADVVVVARDARPGTRPALDPRGEPVRVVDGRLLVADYAALIAWHELDGDPPTVERGGVARPLPEFVRAAGVTGSCGQAVLVCGHDGIKRVACTLAGLLRVATGRVSFRDGADGLVVAPSGLLSQTRLPTDWGGPHQGTAGPWPDAADGADGGTDGDAVSASKRAPAAAPAKRKLDDLLGSIGQELKGWAEQRMTAATAELEASRQRYAALAARNAELELQVEVVHALDARARQLEAENRRLAASAAAGSRQLTAALDEARGSEARLSAELELARALETRLRAVMDCQAI